MVNQGAEKKMQKVLPTGTALAPKLHIAANARVKCPRTPAPPQLRVLGVEGAGARTGHPRTRNGARKKANTSQNPENGSYDGCIYH